jgi:hypothetical protein
MKTLLLLILFCGSLKAQKLVKVVYFPPSTLEDIDQEFLRMIDSLNVNNIKRLTPLDSAASYHVKYLFELNKSALGGSDNKVYLSHYETEDLDNFIEKRNPKDRTGHAMTFEICHHSVKVGTMFLNGRNAPFFKMIENKTNALDLLNYMGDSQNASDIFAGYKSSPGHYAIINSEDVGYFGSKTILFGAARFYESDREADSMEYVFYMVNVTVFFDKRIPMAFVIN